MAVTPEEARRELARRELERRRSQSEQEQPDTSLSPDAAAVPIYNDPRGAAFTVGSGLAATPLSGLAGITGILAGLVPGGESPIEKGARFQEATQDALTIDPPNPASARAVERLGQAAEGAERLARIPLSGLAGATQLMSPIPGRAERAADIQSRVQEQGLGPVMGEALFERTGSPALATAAEIAPTAAGTIAGARLGRNAVPRPAPGPRPGNIVPEINELYKASSAAFNRARMLGGGIKDDALERALRGVREFRNDVGLKVGFDPDLHPQATSLQQKLVREFESGNVDFDRLLELRELAGDVAGNMNKAEAFRGMLLKNSIDDFVKSLGPDDVLGGNPQQAAQALETARDLWRDASKARAIERQINLAGIDAGDFTGAGFENKLRIRFRQLARRIEQGREKGFTPEEVAAIERVANGGTLDNIFRFIGKAAPTGIVSGGIGAGVGFQIGGPAGAAAVPAIGAIGRTLGTRATIRNAERALNLPRQRSLLEP